MQCQRPNLNSYYANLGHVGCLIFLTVCSEAALPRSQCTNVPTRKVIVRLCWNGKQNCSLANSFEKEMTAEFCYFRCQRVNWCSWHYILREILWINLFITTLKSIAVMREWGPGDTVNLRCGIMSHRNVRIQWSWIRLPHSVFSTVDHGTAIGHNSV